MEENKVHILGMLAGLGGAAITMADVQAWLGIASGSIGFILGCVAAYKWVRKDVMPIFKKVFGGKNVTGGKT